MSRNDFFEIKLNYPRQKAGEFSTPLKRAKGKQKVSKILQGVDLLIFATPLVVNILRLKTRVLNPEGDNKLFLIFS